MKAPEIPANEEKRLSTLRSLEILDTPAEERFDRLTRIAQRVLGVPISLVSLVDAERQWFKSRIGLDAEETSRDVSFCGHAILGDEPFVVNDAATDSRFSDNPLVSGDPRIRFYAGCPLRAPGGEKLGTLCVIDTRPRSLSEEDRQVLRDLAALAERELSAVQLALVDELTGIPNRRGFSMLGEHALALSTRQGTNATLAFFDLNEFKPINDRFGHSEGDRALRTFATVLREHLRSTDVCGRIGGDEFAALLVGTDESHADSVVHRFQKRLKARAKSDARGYTISFAAGIVEYESGAHSTMGALLQSADALMYKQKQASKDPGSR